MAAHPAFLVPYRFLPPRSGGQQAAYGLCQALGKQLPLTAVSTTDNEQPRGLAFRLAALLPRTVLRYVAPGTAWRTGRLLRREGHTHLIVQQPFAALLMRLVCWWAGIPLYVYSHNLEYLRFRSQGAWFWPLVWGVEGMAYRLADAVFFISEDEIGPAQNTFGLRGDRCHLLPFGTFRSTAPSGREAARRQVREQLNMREDESLLLFFGSLSYGPNLRALDVLLRELLPRWEALAGRTFRLIICGGGLPREYDGLVDYRHRSVQYMGFVPDLTPWIQACDLMVNPVDTGAGIKTKVIDALADGATVLSFESGARGVDAQAATPKLVAVADGDYEGFAAEALRLMARPWHPTPASFYQKYHWDRAIVPLVDLLKKSSR